MNCISKNSLTNIFYKIFTELKAAATIFLHSVLSAIRSVLAPSNPKSENHDFHCPPIDGLLGLPTKIFIENRNKLMHVYFTQKNTFP